MTKKNKIGIICFWDRYATPYLKKYENILNENKIDFDVILWQRDLKPTDQFTQKDIVIKIPVEDTISSKAIAFFKWRKAVLKVISKNKYDKLIVLSTLPGLLLYTELKKHYYKNFIFDIRDYTYEIYGFFSRLEKKVIESSAFTTISSSGFKKWLPKYEYVLNHNITHWDQPDFKAKELSDLKKYNFTFVGNVRLYEAAKNLLLALKDNKRINQVFIGRDMRGNKIERMKTENNITNVTLKGAFPPEQKPLVYKDVHFINSVYGNKGKILELVVGTAIPNKLYDAAVFRCPIVASEGTYLAEEINLFGLGFAVNYSGNDFDLKLDEFLKDYNPQKFDDNCVKFIQKVKKDESYLINRLVDFCK